MAKVQKLRPLEVKKKFKLKTLDMIRKYIFSLSYKLRQDQSVNVDINQNKAFSIKNKAINTTNPYIICIFYLK
jgi:hypothetical protein